MKPYEKLHEILTEYAFLFCMSRSEVLAFLTCSLVKTMEAHGYSEEFFKKTLDRMMVKFKEKRKETKG